MLMLLAPLAAMAAAGPEVHGVVMPRSGVRPIDRVPVDTTGMGVSVQAWGLSTPTPPLTLVRDRWRLANLFAFEHTSLRTDDAPDFLATPTGRQDLYRAQWSLVSVWTPSDEATLLLVAQPGLYTDFDGPLSGRDLGFVAIGVGTWTFSDQLTAGLGAGYIQLFGRPTVSPFLALDAELGPVVLHVLAPREAELWVHPVEPLGLGVVGTTEGGFYHVHPDDPAVSDAYQEYSVITVGPAAALTLRDRLRLTVHGGRALRRELEVYRDEDSLLVDFAAEPGWVLGAGLQVVLDTGDDDE